VAHRVPRSMIVTTVLAVLVTAGAVGGAAAIRWRAADAAGTPPTSENPPTTSVGVGGCLKEPCTVLAATTVGGTSVELVADAGATSGRLRIGGVTSSQVIETTITGTGVKLTAESLQCVAGGPAACMIKGKHADGLAGEIVVGRSGNWSAVERPFLSDAGYLTLGSVDNDSAPEVLAAQHDCRNADADCAGRPVFLQVFTYTGTVVGCTKNYPRLDRLPGWPAVHVAARELSPCRSSTG
jgi:hypothetical protein